MQYEVRVPERMKEPGVLFRLYVAVGEEVRGGERIGTVVSGNERYGLYSPADGTVYDLWGREGRAVDPGDRIAVVDDRQGGTDFLDWDEGEEWKRGTGVV